MINSSIAGRLGPVLVGAAALFGAPAGLAAEDGAQPTTQAFEHWTLRCDSSVEESARRCEISSTLSVPGAAGQEESVTTLLNVRTPRPSQYVMTLRLPDSVWLPAGVTVTDEQNREVTRMAYLVCQNKACDAGAELSEEAMSAWGDAGERASIVYQTPTGQRISVTFSMAGFAEALAHLPHGTQAGSKQRRNLH